MSLTSRLSESSQTDVLVQQSTKPVQLQSVSVTGGDFSDEYLHKLVDPTLNDKPVMSFADLHNSLGNMEQTLLYTGLFRDVKIKLDLDQSKLSSSTSSSSTATAPTPVKADVTLTDLPLFKYGSYSKTTDYDVASGFRYLHPNFTKNADTLLVDINFNYDPFQKTVNRKVWDITYLHPLAGKSSGSASRVVLNPTVATVDATKWASHQQYAVGTFLGYQNTKVSDTLSAGGISIFTGGVSGTLRQVSGIANSASDIIRTYAGGDIKLGATANYKLDTREYSGKFATSGFLLDVTNEFAGHNSVDYQSFQNNSSVESQQQQLQQQQQKPQQAHQQQQQQHQQHIELQPFNKTTIKFEGAKSLLWNNITASVDLEAGLIKSFVADGAEKLHISDKFFLGGLHSLKGFQLNSVGVKNGNDYVGGTSAFKLGVSLYSRVPNTHKNSPLRLYSFVNAGDVHSYKSTNEYVEAVTTGEIITKAAAATGVGIAYKADNAILDLSYNLPLTNRSQDESKPGLSFAVVLNFK